MARKRIREASARVRGDRSLDLVRVRVALPARLPVPPLQDDRRRFHPAGPLRPAFSFRAADRRIVVKQSSRSAPKRNDTYSDWRVAFAVPHRVAVCVRRKQRREVIHALKLTGKGSRARRHRRNTWSDVDCR